jgi:hemerythrin superfamily protein
MEQYDKEFLDYMRTKYKLTLDEATNGTEPQVIKFAVAWDVWKHAKSIYYDAKKESITDFMSKDHSRLDHIFQTFRKSKNDNERRQLFLEFKAGLERHMGWEENILFPPVKRELGDDSGMIDELIMQHNRMREDLNGIASGQINSSVSFETDMEQLLAAHDKMEEEGIYPWVDDNLENKEKTEILSKILNSVS